MLPSNALSRALLALIAIAVIAMPMSGAHLHLCFDGGEQPATLHLTEDGGQHTEPGTSGKHSDTDLELGAPAIAKKADGVVKLPSLMAVAFVLFLIPAPTPPVLPQSDDRTVVVPSDYRIVPPLRAPPAQASIPA